MLLAARVAARAARSRSSRSSLATVVVAGSALPVATIGAIPAGLPAPSLPPIEPGDLGSLLVPAVAVAALAALESLMSATVADGMSVGERHDSDRELFGQGIANLVTPLFGGIPATAAIARTAVNVRSGARSRLAAITQSLALLAVVLVASRGSPPSRSRRSRACCIATALQMVEVSSLAALLRSTRGDAAALVITAGATIVLDLVTAVILGPHRRRARSPSSRWPARRGWTRSPLDHADHTRRGAGAVRRAHRRLPPRRPAVLRCRPRVPPRALRARDVRVVVLRMSRIATLDATGASVLADTIKRLEARGVTVLLSGVRPEHAPVLSRLGVYDELATEHHVFGSTPDAITHARTHARRLAHRPGDLVAEAAGG